MERATAHSEVARALAAEGSVRLPCDAGTAAYARVWAAWQLDMLLPWVPVALLRDIQLVISELATNALRAGSLEATLRLAHEHGTVRVSVHDDASGTPAILQPDADETHGRGLMIVAAVADAWGVTPYAPQGKDVWADFTTAGHVDERAADERLPAGMDVALDAVLGDGTSRTATDALIGDLLEQVRRTMQVDTSAILLIDDSRQFLVATAARGIEEEVRHGVRIRVGVGFAGRIAAERRPVVLNRLTPSNVVNPLLIRRGITSMLGVPIVDGERVIGVMHVGSLTPRQFTATDTGMLQRAAGRASQVLLRHRSYVDRAGAAALLQSLTPRLPDLPELELSARYVPGSQYGVGGDWYDVFRLPSGLVGVVIGDVMGHGLHAATVMGRMRSALRSYALEYEDPATVLTKLDRKIQHFEADHLATVLYGVLDPGTGHVTAASAGHLPAILIRSQGDAEQVRLPVGPPIGVPTRIVRHSGSFSLTPRAVLCLYTDGVVERRTRDLGDEVDRLQAALSVVPLRTADAACVQAMSEMVGEREPEDDISMLAMMWLPAERS